MTVTPAVIIIHRSVPMLEQLFLLLVFVHVFTSTLCNLSLIRKRNALEQERNDLHWLVDNLLDVISEMEVSK
jgi:hypothetical protein